VPSELPFVIELNNGDESGSPFATPQKSVSNSPAPQTQPQSVNARSKARNANKPRPKSGFAPSSPGPAKPRGRTPPNGLPARPPAEAAFAGATFHASPAPSSLPIPSFLTKAMDSPQVLNTGPAKQQPSPPLSDSEVPTPRQGSALAREVAREESPLDFLFNRQKAEREQARRAGSGSLVASPPGPYSPPHAYIQSSPQPKTVPSKPPATLPRYDLLQRNSSASRIPTTELDGTPGRRMGPAFSTPWAERMRNIQAGRNSSPTTPQQAQSSKQFEQPQQPSTSAAVGDKAEALKKLLAISSPPPLAPFQSGPENEYPLGKGPQRLPGNPIQPPPQQPQRQPYVSGPSGQSVDLGPEGQRSLDVQRMEDTLRRVLKLDGGTTLTS
jgi:hypothetical protein